MIFYKNIIFLKKKKITECIYFKCYIHLTILNSLFLNNYTFNLKELNKSKQLVTYKPYDKHKGYYLKHKHFAIMSLPKKLLTKYLYLFTVKKNIDFKKFNTNKIFKNLIKNNQKKKYIHFLAINYLKKKKTPFTLNYFNAINTFKENIKKPLNLVLKKKKYIFSISRRSFLNRKDSFFLLNSRIISFLLFFFKKNIFFTFKKLNPHTKNIEFDNEVKYIIWKMVSKYKKKIKHIFLKTFYKSLFFSLKLKDPNFFLEWYIKKIEAISPQKHKFMIHIFYILLKKFHRYIFFSSNVKGVFFYISGKIGVSGDSKKRNIFFNFGKHSGSKKNLKINSVKSKIKTFTGVLGVTFNIYF